MLPRQVDSAIAGDPPGGGNRPGQDPVPAVCGTAASEAHCPAALPRASEGASGSFGLAAAPRCTTPESRPKAALPLWPSEMARVLLLRTLSHRDGCVKPAPTAAHCSAERHRLAESTTRRPSNGGWHVLRARRSMRREPLALDVHASRTRGRQSSGPASRLPVLWFQKDRGDLGSSGWMSRRPRRLANGYADDRNSSLLIGRSWHGV